MSSVTLTSFRAFGSGIVEFDPGREGAGKTSVLAARGVLLSQVHGSVATRLGRGPRFEDRTSGKDLPSSTFAEMFGSYLGEVYRRSRGGTWGYFSETTERFPGLHADGIDFWPWSRTHKRLVDGEADDVWAYFQAIVRPQP